jgi:hypothetical protein
MASYGDKPDQTQNLLSVRTWEFRSPRPHQQFNPLVGFGSNASPARLGAGIGRDGRPPLVPAPGWPCPRFSR